MNIQWVGPAPASNFHVGREGNPITLVVQHWMDGTIAAALARFMNPASIVSAHYLVGQQRGQILQLVKDEDTAFQAGDWNVNLLSIGIEAEASPTMAPTDDLYANLADLYRYLSQTHDIALTVGTTVKPHRAIVPTECPGTIDLDRIVKEATMNVPIYAGQSVADVNIAVGEVAEISGIWTYDGKGNRTIVEKVYGTAPGIFPVTLRPPADPDADPTLVLNAQPAYFVIAVRPV